MAETTTTTTTTTTTATTPPSPPALTEETRVAVLNAESNDAIGHCLVCYSNLTYLAVTDCGHNEICGTCHLRLRHLHNDKKCPICKTPQETIVVDEALKAKSKLSDYPIWGNDLGADFVFSEDVGMFFRKDYYETNIQPLFGYHCTKENCPYDGSTPDKNIYDKQQQKNNSNRPPPTPIRALQDHLRNAHRLALCQLCVDHQRDFVARLPRFTPAQLQRHLKQGDGKESGFQGHPVCEFCRPTRFYDITALHTHLAKEHYKCHVCEQSGVPNQYFKHYPSLEKHFDRQHFLCHDVQCLTARFVVFSNELDLRHHERQVHGGTSTGDTKLQLEFRVRRSGEDPNNFAQQEAPSDQDFNYGLDGEAFVPADLPQSDSHNNLTTLHPLHVQRTAELREQAATLREEERPDTAEAFPSLQESNGAGEQTMRVGWTSKGTLKRVGRKKDAGQVTDQDFPTLPTAAGPKNSRKLTGSLATTQRQFAAMSASANQAANWKSGPTPAAAMAPHNSATNLSSDNFPSLGGGRPVQQPYTAANALAKKNQANLTADNFPSLGASSGPKPNNYAAANALARKNQKAAPPSWDSASDFPAPPSAAAPQRSRLREPRANTAAASNTLHIPGVAVTAHVTLDEIKTSMGSNRYKKLKGYTRDFASGDMQPDAYVDHAATLFDRGYADVDFWRFMPTLIGSCPNPSSSDQAMRYLENLKRMRNGAINAEAQQQKAAPPAAAAAASNSNWSAGPRVAASAPSWSGKPSTTPSGMRYVAPPPRGGIPSAATKKTGGWGGGTQASVMRAKAPPGSVSVAAATAGPQSGSATKFMAKQQKQQAKQQPSKNSKKKKKKQNNELRALAFGS